MNRDEIRPGIGSTKLSFAAKKAQAESAGKVFNACPCGCETEQLTKNGYCKHLVGFARGVAKPGELVQPPPVGTRMEMRANKMQYTLTEEPGSKQRELEEAVMLMTPEELVRFGYVAGDDRVKEKDILVQISDCFRVYRGERVIKEEEASNDTAALVEQNKKLREEMAELRQLMLEHMTKPEKKELVEVG